MIQRISESYKYQKEKGKAEKGGVLRNVEGFRCNLRLEGGMGANHTGTWGKAWQTAKIARTKALSMFKGH